MDVIGSNSPVQRVTKQKHFGDTGMAGVDEDEVGARARRRGSFGGWWHAEDKNGVIAVMRSGRTKEVRRWRSGM